MTVLLFIPAEVLEFRVAALTPTIDLRDKLRRSLAALPQKKEGR